MELAFALAAIVSMLAVFKGERNAATAATAQEYAEWLRARNHEQLANLILDNAELMRSLDSLMQQNHDQVMGMLQELARAVADIAARLDGFKQVAEAMPVKSRLSEQAISILRQLNESGASGFFGYTTRAGTVYEMSDAEGMLDIEMQRYVEDDLARLCELGLLRPSFSSSGNPVYTITRRGAQVGG